MAPPTQEDAEVQARFQSFDMRTHVEKKGMWAGRTTLASIPDLEGAFYCQVPDGEGATHLKAAVLPVPREHTPALLKAFDEYLVNASDHAVECAPSRARHGRVTAIDVQFGADGVFTVTNDGPGIPVVVHAAVSAAQGRPVYIPEIAFCHLLSGSNMEKAADSVKGGINGVGAKIGNIHAACFRFTTVGAGAAGLLYYSQRCRDRMTAIEPPEIVELRAWPAERGPKPAPFTRVQMLPAYAALGYADATAAAHAAGGPWRAAHLDIEAWLRLRCCQLAAYLGPGVKVALNGTHVSTTTPALLAPLYARTQLGTAPYKILETTMKAAEAPYKAHPWKVCLVVSAATRAFGHHTVVNGVVTKSGPHVTYIKGLLKEAALKRVQATVRDKDQTATPAELCKHCVVFMVGALPGADWTGQRKDELTVPGAALRAYKFPAAWLREAGELLCRMYLQHSAAHRRKPKVKPEKYTPAQSAGPKKGGPTASLLIAEGDSAIALIRKGIGARLPGGPTFQQHGIFSLGGVPMNAAKKVTDVSAQLGGDAPRLRRTKHLEDNKTFSSLEAILGLDHACSYEQDAAGQAEFARLNYASVVACVDQDLDGAGKILGLVLTYFNLFWPALIRRGYLRWFMTPVIRAYPRAAATAALRKKHGALAEFYHEQEFERWAAAADRAGTQYRVSYHKGLGGHEDFEVPRMFGDFERKLYTFVMDAGAPALFDVYYGPATGPRKEALGTPLAPLGPAELAGMDAAREVPCSTQLGHYTKAYKLDAIQRQLPGCLDGMTVGRRKAFDGARKRFRRASDECMTFQLAGFVADKELYHHGGASMESTLVHMCQTFPGTRQVPLLIGSGCFGTRLKGGEDAASPRYTKIALNLPLANCLLPPEDDWLLPYEFVDGQRAQPHSYVPVIPLSAVDNMEIPSEGWNYKAWGRRISQVVAVLRAACDAAHPGHLLAAALAGVAGAPPAAGEVRAALMPHFRAAFPLDVSLRGLTGPVGMRNGRPHHFGVYAVNTLPGDPDGEQGCLLQITDLPLRMWTTKYSEGLLKPRAKTAACPAGAPSPRARYVDGDVRDFSGDVRCNINVRLRPGALAQIRADYGPKVDAGGDPVAEFLGIHTSLTSNLNVIRPHPQGGGGVIEFGDDYHALVLYHVPVRARYYRLRFERRQAVLELRLRMEEEVVRYLALSSELQINKIADVGAAGRALAAHAFPRINKARVDSPQYETVAELRALIVEAAAGEGEAGEGEAGEGEAEAGEGEAEAEDGEGKASAPSRASYNYILNLKERDLLVSSRARRAAKVEALRAQLAETGAVLAEAPFAGASAWLRELAELERVLRDQGYYS